jgi:hypothetical protein
VCRILNSYTGCFALPDLGNISASGFGTISGDERRRQGMDSVSMETVGLEPARVVYSLPAATPLGCRQPPAKAPSLPTTVQIIEPNKRTGRRFLKDSRPLSGLGGRTRFGKIDGWAGPHGERSGYWAVAAGPQSASTNPSYGLHWEATRTLQGVHHLKDGPSPSYYPAGLGLL